MAIAGEHNYKKAMEYANEWVASLDRSGLGSFAVDAGVLAAASAHMRGMRLYGTTRDAATVAGLLFKEITDATYAVAGDGAFGYGQRAKSEAVLWWSMGTKDSTSRDCMSVALNTEPFVASEVARLRLVLDYPDFHDYFTAGIWNLDLIERCIAEDIDPSLAADLSF